MFQEVPPRQDVRTASRVQPRPAGRRSRARARPRRWRSGPPRAAGAAAPSTDLDAILHEDFEALREDRIAEDARIEAYAQSLTAESLEVTLAYVNNEGREFRDPLAVLLTHFFDHQTHHRGQVTAMLTQTDVICPVLDMHRVLIPEPGKPVAWG